MPRKPARRLDDDDIRRIEAERNKTLPRGSRWHQYWCAIFRGKPCDCEDDAGGQRRRQPRPRSGGSSANAKVEFEDA